MGFSVSTWQPWRRPVATTAGRTAGTATSNIRSGMGLGQDGIEVRAHDGAAKAELGGACDQLSAGRHRPGPRPRRAP